MIDNLSKFGWAVSLKNDNAQTIKAFCQTILIISKRNPDLFEADDRNNVSKTFAVSLNKKDIER